MIRRTPTKRASRTPAEGGGPARPFLKWAGGKSQLLGQLEALLPQGLADGSIDTYVEPFVGAGALFFHIAQNYPSVKHAYLYDVNEELCLAYAVVKDHVGKLVTALDKLRARYFGEDDQGRERLFYEIRERYNAAKPGFDYQRFGAAWVARAAQLMFLNKTCFNGLFRTNSRGEFNAPFGRYRNPAIVDPYNLQAASRLLGMATITCGDFEHCTDHIDKDTFVYFDPPYRPISSTSNFTAYSRDSFGDEDQTRLGRFFARLDREHGARLMLSNSDPTNVDPTDLFFDTLYRDYRVERVRASRMINSNASRRGRIRELVVMNYESRKDQ